MARVKDLEKTPTKTRAMRPTKIVKIGQAMKPTSNIRSRSAKVRVEAGFNNRLEIFSADPQTRIEIIRKGIPAQIVADLSMVMGMSKEGILSSLGLNRATISRKEKTEAALNKEESEKVLGMGVLINLVQKMVEQSGGTAGFDAARWVSTWLAKPLPALGGKTPASYMDTFEGQRLVADLLSMSQSGAYA